MSQSFNLYIDTTACELVTSPTNSNAPEAIIWNQGDIKFFNIYLLQRSSGYPEVNPFALILNAGLTLLVDIGPRDGIPGDPSYTWNYSWTADPTNSYFSGALSLNQTAINELLIGNPSVEAWLQIRFLDGSGNQFTVLQQQIAIVATVGSTQTAATPAQPLIPISIQQANNLYALKIGNPGDGIILVSPDGTKKIRLSCDNAGAFRADPLQ